MTAKAINNTGMKMKNALRMLALVALSLPPSFKKSPSAAELCRSDLSWASVCLAMMTNQAANPAMARVHHRVEVAIIPRLRV